MAQASARSRSWRPRTVVVTSLYPRLLRPALGPSRSRKAHSSSEGEMSDLLMPLLRSTATITSSSIRTTITQFITVASSTITSTFTEVDILHKRAPAPSPAVQAPAVVLSAALAASTGGDPYLSASISSACSCLFLDPLTTRVRTTVYTVNLLLHYLRITWTDLPWCRLKV